MNKLDKLPSAALITTIVLLLAQITFWSATIVLLTVLAVPGFIIWVVGAYIMNYLALSSSGLRVISKTVLPSMPRKHKRVRTH